MSQKLKKSALALAMTAGALMSSNALSQKAPNVLILWGDDIGQFKCRPAGNAGRFSLGSSTCNP